MLLFFGKELHRIIPLERVYEIVANGNEICVTYEGGDSTDYEGQAVKVSSFCKLKFEDEEEVHKVIRQFYKAVNSGANAFFFG